VTWSLLRLCICSRSFTTNFQSCNPTNIRRVAIDNPRISLTICIYFTATQRISVWSQILNAGGERARKTAQSAYSSCHDTIRTQKFECSQSCMKCKVGTVVQFQPSQKPTVLCLVRVTTTPTQCSSGLSTSLELNRTVSPVETWTAARSPGPVANTSCSINKVCR